MAVHFDVTNGGTGPAVIDWLTMSHAGRPIANVGELLDACCRTERSRHLGLPITNIASGQTLPAGQSITLFTAAREGSDPETYARLESWPLRVGRARLLLLGAGSVLDHRLSPGPST